MTKHLLLLLLPSLAHAQAVRRLSAPEVEFPTPFSSINGVREVGDRRVIVVDRRERSALLVDLARGTSQRVGREGAGPGEIAQPANILAMGGDTTAIWDGRNARLFLVDHKQGTGRAVPLTGAEGKPLANLQAPRFADAAGRLYFVGVPAEGEEGDSLPILRFDRGTFRLDTVGALRRPKGGDQAVMGPPGKQMTMNFANPFSPAEAWVVTAAGEVAVVRSPEYRVDWTHPHKRRGADMPFGRIEVSDAEKDNWRRTMQRSSLAMVADAGARGPGSASAPAIGSIPEPTQWPKVMPPFLASATVLVDALGRVWVPRARAWTETITQYDIFDRDSRVVMRVALADNRRVVGFGRDVVYTVRPDDDDLLHLGRHALPR